jgi:hypothetical protein
MKYLMQLLIKSGYMNNLNQNRMSTKDKATDIYTRSIRLHGLIEGKQHAIDSAVAIQTLATYDQQKYWQEVITLIQSK